MSSSVHGRKWWVVYHDMVRTKTGLTNIDFAVFFNDPWDTLVPASFWYIFYVFAALRHRLVNVRGKKKPKSTRSSRTYVCEPCVLSTRQGILSFFRTHIFGHWSTLLMQLLGIRYLRGKRFWWSSGTKCQFHPDTVRKRCKAIWKQLAKPFLP